MELEVTEWQWEQSQLNVWEITTVFDQVILKLNICPITPFPSSQNFTINTDKAKSTGRSNLISKVHVVAKDRF